MKKFSKKSVLLFAAAMATCALAPSMASAASWSPIGSEHTLDSPNGTFALESSGITSTCGESFFTASVTNAMDLEITSAVFRRCTASGGLIGSCTKTMTATNLPWTATPTSTTNVDIRNIVIDVVLENEPGSNACNAAGVNITITGGIVNGDWNNTTREGVLNGVTGLLAHSPLGNNLPITLSGTVRDTQQTLQILP
jgi:hypothetical protein